MCRQSMLGQTAAFGFGTLRGKVIPKVLWVFEYLGYHVDQSSQGVNAQCRVIAWDIPEWSEEPLWRAFSLQDMIA